MGVSHEFWTRGCTLTQEMATHVGDIMFFAQLDL